MRTIQLLICLLCVATSVMSAQEADKYYVEIGSAIGLMSLNDSDDELVTRDFAVSFGYDFSKRFTAKIPLTLSTGLFKNDKSGVKSYETTGTIGVGAGYNIVVKPSYKLQLSGEIGNTLSGDDDKWNFFYYDAGCKFYLGKTTDRVNAIAGLGVKQMFTDEKSSVDFAVPYVSIGFRLNKFKRK